MVVLGIIVVLLQTVHMLWMMEQRHPGLTDSVNMPLPPYRAVCRSRPGRRRAASWRCESSR